MTTSRLRIRLPASTAVMATSTPRLTSRNSDALMWTPFPTPGWAPPTTSISARMNYPSTLRTRSSAQPAAPSAPRSSSRLAARLPGPRSATRPTARPLPKAARRAPMSRFSRQRHSEQELIARVQFPALLSQTPTPSRTQTATGCPTGWKTTPGSMFPPPTREPTPMIPIPMMMDSVMDAKYSSGSILMTPMTSQLPERTSTETGSATSGATMRVVFRGSLARGNGIS